jgi:hypothetical protein
MVERAQHRGDVAERRARRGPLRDRPRRLALEVEDEQAIARAQDLADVEVAVDALERRRLAGRSSAASSARMRGSATRSSAATSAGTISSTRSS